MRRCVSSEAEDAPEEFCREKVPGAIFIVRRCQAHVCVLVATAYLEQELHATAEFVTPPMAMSTLGWEALPLKQPAPGEWNDTV